MNLSVKIHSVKATDAGFIIVMTAEHYPDAAVAVALPSGTVTEDLVVERFRHAFRTLKNGIIADGKDAA